MSFSDGLEPAFSHLTLTTSSGEEVPLQGQKIGGDDGSQLTAAPLQPLPAGSYEARWDVLSKDGHKSSGTLEFKVEP
jgi:methionine-rich copper-binding protein CopC